MGQARISLFYSIATVAVAFLLMSCMDQGSDSQTVAPAPKPDNSLNDRLVSEATKFLQADKEYSKYFAVQDIELLDKLSKDKEIVAEFLLHSKVIYAHKRWDKDSYVGGVMKKFVGQPTPPHGAVGSTSMKLQFDKYDSGWRASRVITIGR